MRRNRKGRQMMVPATREDMKQLGWTQLDVVLVTGDAFIDSPYIGVAVVARALLSAGFRVGVISQPDIHSGIDISRLGEPRLFWGVTGGNIDSMVANYTATGKFRKSDDYTPGGQNTRRPDRAAIVYTQLIRQHFKGTCPIVLGGIEASLRRVSHYDFWSNRVRRSILFDAKADFLAYGMAEKTVVSLAEAFSKGNDPEQIRGICYISPRPVDGYLELPAHETVAGSKQAFIDMFRLFYDETDPVSAKGICQLQDTRYLIQNPPPPLLSGKELDAVHDLPFTHDLHPFDARKGDVRALETIRFSITTHRGCYGECHFCAIGVHQGRTVQWRSETSIIREVLRLSKLDGFKGIIQDVGGPTANMFGYECEKKLKKGICRNRRCVFPEICQNLPVNHLLQTRLLNKIRNLPEVRKVFVRSGIRYDLLNADNGHGPEYLKTLVSHHVSGQLKVAPEHTNAGILYLMGKQKIEHLQRFKHSFDSLTRQCGKPQYLTYYFIAGHPGCTEDHMRELKAYADNKLRMTPEQVQIFTPTPSTFSSLMYYTELDPFTGKPVFVEKNLKKKEFQKHIVTRKHPAHKKYPPKKKPGGSEPVKNRRQTRYKNEKAVSHTKPRRTRRQKK
jgi:uncharacterized radical SAM protein YgiQ